MKGYDGSIRRVWRVMHVLNPEAYRQYASIFYLPTHRLTIKAISRASCHESSDPLFDNWRRRPDGNVAKNQADGRKARAAGNRGVITITIIK